MSSCGMKGKEKEKEKEVQKFKFRYWFAFLQARVHFQRGEIRNIHHHSIGTGTWVRSLQGFSLAVTVVFSSESFSIPFSPLSPLSSLSAPHSPLPYLCILLSNLVTYRYLRLFVSLSSLCLY